MHEDIRKCAFCGKIFVAKHHNQIYCSVECRKKATYQRKKLERQRISEIQSKRNTSYDPRCCELWKQYLMYKRLGWVEQYTFERKLRDSGCWFKRKFTLTKEEKRLAEKHDKRLKNA